MAWRAWRNYPMTDTTASESELWPTTSAMLRAESNATPMTMPRCCPLACAAAGSSSTATQHAATAHGFVHIFCFVEAVVSEVPRWIVID